MASFWEKLPFIGRGAPTVAVLRLNGPIGMPSAFGRSLSLASLAGPIEHAFNYRNLKALALSINSPGGSPVQSALIHRRIRDLADEKGIPVFAFVEDAGASGGYWLALAGDEIFADASSIVGSIGVISAGFGFPDLIEKLGIERRVYTAGESKSTLDPFKAEDPEDVKRIEALQKDIHGQFKALVKSRRGDLLKGTDKKLFSGEFWTGLQAEKLGLVDGIGDLRSVMRKRFGDKVRLRAVSAGGPWWSRRAPFRESAAWSPGFALGRGPASWADDLLASVEARALWSRFGL